MPNDPKPKSQEEILAKDQLWSFDSVDTFHISGRGKAFVVKCPINCLDFDWLIGHDAIIDGKTYKIVGVERFMHSPPWKKGEDISLLIADYGAL
jgi:hypothetical protein